MAHFTHVLTFLGRGCGSFRPLESCSNPLRHECKQHRKLEAAIPDRPGPRFETVSDIFHSFIVLEPNKTNSKIIEWLPETL